MHAGVTDENNLVRVWRDAGGRQRRTIPVRVIKESGLDGSLFERVLSLS